MKLITLLLIIMLTGCVTPVARNFPSIPESLKTKCENLSDTPLTDKLSVVLSVVTKNYSQYQECSAKVDIWLEWYSKQKKIFDTVK
jgi:hypothetical protein